MSCTHHWLIESCREYHSGGYVIGWWQGYCTKCGAPGEGPVKVPMRDPSRQYRDWLSEAEDGCWSDTLPDGETEEVP